MRYLKAVFVGLVGGVLVTTAVLSVEVVHAQRSMSAQMANCEAALNGGGGICSGYAQTGAYELPIAFAIGFIGPFVWFRRRQQRLVSP
jgi:hypothetical protein